MSTERELQRDIFDFKVRIKDPKERSNFLKSFIESVMFVSNEPLNVRKIEELTGAKKITIYEAIPFPSS